MDIRWQKLILSMVIWAIAEVVLNLVGMDDMVDYSEYILVIRETTLIVRQSTQEQLIPMHRAVPEVLISA
ncbi:hypothetical protein [Lyngbya confervoides]|uniref:Uncharacterized protein n=1 Tax=Lyngbya confervoides BDU141951 TaxID=1574623 RepID=A0ABD4T7S7_9CYAN|nr:hypothetical protein [Lyngbya confervoides]MCM1984637.1 hypothetical protein [Lyngbya confervoides BDU141951]